MSSVTPLYPYDRVLVYADGYQGLGNLSVAYKLAGLLVERGFFNKEKVALGSDHVADYSSINALSFRIASLYEIEKIQYFSLQILLSDHNLLRLASNLTPTLLLTESDSQAVDLEFLDSFVMIKSVEMEQSDERLIQAVLESLQALKKRARIHSVLSYKKPVFYAHDEKLPFWKEGVTWLLSDEAVTEFLKALSVEQHFQLSQIELGDQERLAQFFRELDFELYAKLRDLLQDILDPYPELLPEVNDPLPLNTYVFMGRRQERSLEGLYPKSEFDRHWLDTSVCLVKRLN